MEDQYYTVMIPKQYHDSDLDRQKKLLELGDPTLFVNYTNLSSRVASAPIKIKSAAVQVPNSKSSTTSDIQKQRELLGLGSVNSFGGSPMAEALAARQRSNR
jgi:hypothetical protein